VPFTTVLIMEQNLYTAQNDLAMAEGNVSTDLATVYEALGGRMADPRGQRIRARCDGRRDEKPHQLGRAAAAARHAATGCPAAAHAARRQPEPPGAGMVRSL
jgi:hypothetical protein